MTEKIVFFDLEINSINEITDIGAIKYEIKDQNNLIKIGNEFHDKNIDEFYNYINNCEYICGHNIFNHDLKYIEFNKIYNKIKIDTLLLDPLLFPDEEHHDLIKNYKTEEENKNNPLEDAKETKEKFLKQIEKFQNLTEEDKIIYCTLLYNICNKYYYIFKGFFLYNKIQQPTNKENLIKIISKKYADKICNDIQTKKLLEKYYNYNSIELSYTLASINTKEKTPKLSKWVKYKNEEEKEKTNYPETINIFRKLRGTLCNNPTCEYCNNIKKELNNNLSEKQRKIVEKDNKYIIINAGPGSGKTEVLIKIIARKILINHINPSDILMLSFSKGAVEEFRKRINKLLNPYIENTYDLEIRTFHSWCFKILEKEPNKNEFEQIEGYASEWLKTNNIKQQIIILDEAQDLNEKEYEIIEELYHKSKDIIAVGDDDQSIYEFRKETHTNYISELTELCYEIPEQLLNNYRSCKSIVNFANQFRKKINENKELIPKNKNEGICELIQHNSEEMDSAIIEDILKRNPEGSTAILTYENAEAYRIYSALKASNLNKQIKIIEGKENGYIKLYDLEEFRYFIEQLNNKNKTITNKIWTNAKNKTKKYFNNTNSETFNDAINVFEKNHNEKRYNELINYLKESTIADYGTNENNCIIVSTLHRSKGKEFDNVYILLYDNYPYQEAYNNKINIYENTISKESYNKAIYVGITRAKNFLQIHYPKSIKKVFENTITEIIDTKKYKNTEYYFLQLTLADIDLSQFKDVTIKPKYIKLSTKGNDKITKQEEKGYKWEKEEGGYTVKWKDKTMEKDAEIYLPEIWFKKTNLE